MKSYVYTVPTVLILIVFLFSMFCLKVAMTREKFPEKIPFRLTRMLTNAMEVSVMEVIIRLSNPEYRERMKYIKNTI